MKKFNKKAINVLTTAALVASLATPFVAPGTADAAASYSAGTVRNVTPDAQTAQNLGFISVSVPVIELEDQNTLTLRLPAGFDLDIDNPVTPPVAGETTWDIGGVTIEIPTNDNAGFYSTDPNDPTTFKTALSAMTVESISKNELRITFDKNATSTVVADPAESNLKFIVRFDASFVDAGYSGPVTVVTEGSQGSPFANGTITIAQVGSGLVNLTIDDVNTITTAGDKRAIDTIRLREDRALAFTSGKDIKLKLPAGFAWRFKYTNGSYYSNPVPAVGSGLTAETYVRTLEGGLNATVTATDDGRTLVITSNTDTSTPGYILLQNLGVDIVDENVAKLGDVNVTVSGSASVNAASTVVAKYGDYGATAYIVGEPTTVLAGRKDQKIGKFAIEETISRSLLEGRSISLELKGAKWDNATDLRIDSTLSKNGSLLGQTFTFVGSNRDTLRLTVPTGARSGAIKAVYENGKISVPANAKPGDEIKLVVRGNAGVEGEFVIAKVAAPVTLTTDGNVPNVAIGSSAKIPDLVITETAKEAIDYGATADTLTLTWPNGIEPSSSFDVAVTEGDLVLDQSSKSRTRLPDGRWQYNVKVKSTSSTPSKIKFSGMTAKIERLVTEGDAYVALGGSALVQNTSDYAGATSVAAVKFATVVTPAADGTNSTAVFTIDSTSYTVNGVEKTLDVAPFIQDSRTFLPVRFVAEALGVSENNIIWNANTKTVTLIKGDRIAQIQIGSKNLVVNGVTIQMDTAAFIKDGRTVLPLFFVGQALNAEVTWDEATRSVTVKNK